MEYNREKNPEKVGYDSGSGSPTGEGEQGRAVEMTDRKNSVVMQEGADLYGDIETAESE